MGLIQYGIEQAGISTISISHLHELTEKIRLPRALHLRFPLGRSFGKAGEHELQKQILKDCLHYIKEMETPETIVKLPYKWRR